ncbi:MAG: N-acetylmuramoyl-L-alanine amidase [Clostridiales bacterium]|nr:N-acetylmuramoyl-L-alanine amidase [Clostridiales bacterium]
MNNKKVIAFICAFSSLLGACLFFGLYSFGKVDSLTSKKITFSVKSMPVIIIDAGHGGIDGGAVGVDGTYEKDINLAISLKLDTMLKSAGYKTILVRDEDKLICDENLKSIREKKSSDLHNRMELMNKTDNCIFLSIHQNSYPSASSFGTQVFYSPNDDESKTIAGIIQKNIRQMLQPNNKRTIKQSTSSVFLLYYATKPTVMVECGFLTNPNDCEKLKNEEYQNNIAFAIMCSLLEYNKNI